MTTYEVSYKNFTLLKNEKDWKAFSGNRPNGPDSYPCLATTERHHLSGRKIHHFLTKVDCSELLQLLEG